MSSGLQSYWNFDENAGTSAADATGNGNTGTLSSASWTGSGKINSAFYPNANYHVDITGNPSDLSFEYNQAFSVSAWFNTTNSGSQWIVGKSAPTTYRGYLLGMSGGGVLWQIQSNTTGSVKAQITTTGTFNDGSWHHVVGVSTGSGTVAGMSIYIDGSVQGTTTNSDTLASNTIVTPSDVYIGDTVGISRPFHGTLDEVGIWNRALSPNEALTLYHNGNGNQYPFGSFFDANANVSVTAGSLAFGSGGATIGSTYAVTLNGADQTTVPGSTSTIDLSDATGSGAGWSVSGAMTTDYTFTGTGCAPCTISTANPVKLVYAATPSVACDAGATNCTAATTTGITYGATLTIPNSGSSTKVWNANSTGFTGMGNQTATWPASASGIEFFTPGNTLLTGTSPSGKTLTGVVTYTLASGP